MKRRALSPPVWLGALGLLLTGCGDAVVPPTAVSTSPAPTVPPPVSQESSAYIHLASADGSAVTPLTPGGWPAWSPDGRRIAFHRFGHVHVIDADGSNERRLGAGLFPAWSPDGRRIVFASGEGISVMNADGSGVTTLIRHDFRDDTYAEDDMGAGKPAWSPDGERIAFEHFGDGDLQPAQIYVMRADGSDPRRLSTALGWRFAESDPSWSPDGARIVFWSYGHGLVTADLDGGLHSRYRNFPAVSYGARPAWSPDGSTIAFTAGRFSPAGPAIWTLPARGGNPTVLAPGATTPHGRRTARGSRS